MLDIEDRRALFLGALLFLGAFRAATLLFLQDRVADFDALVADVDARGPRDKRGHLMATLLAEGAALYVPTTSRGG